MSTEQEAYDRVAYPCFAYPDTHPDRLAVMAMLHGLSPAPVERCRVLEIGCNEAANLIPMAYAIPGSEFVGFDVAGEPIARGQRRIDELGLSNIRIFQADLTEVDESLGQFDYIIVHGIYAWVPEPVQDRLLAVCKRLLAPDGIAFVSYNALPGGHLRNLMREILLVGAAGEEDAARSVTRGQEFLQFVIASRKPDDPFRAVLERQAKQMETRDVVAIYHDELGREHRPVSFRDFAAHAGLHGLQYVNEATLPFPNDPCFQPEQTAVAERIGGDNRIAQEEIFDLIRMRMYRETLLCHAERAVSPVVNVEAFLRLRFGCDAKSAPGEGEVLRVYTQPGGLQMKSSHPNTVRLMEMLIESWPRSIPYAELEERLGAEGVVFDAEFFALMLRLIVARFVRLHAWQAPVSSHIEERPRASASSRQEAGMHDQVATLLHLSLRFEDQRVRCFLMMLDGTRDRSDLVVALKGRYPEIPETALVEGIEPNLRLLHHAGVLLAEDFR
jgi:SAM-dependent methyltransferase